MVAQSLAERKARTPIITGGGVVIGADTLILLNGSILGKPTDEEDARRMLARLRGSSHHVITGLALIDSTTGKAELASVSTLVRMRSYSDSEIANYIASGEPMDKAGAYAIQEMGGAFVERDPRLLQQRGRPSPLRDQPPTHPIRFSSQRQPTLLQTSFRPTVPSP